MLAESRLSLIPPSAACISSLVLRHPLYVQSRASEWVRAPTENRLLPCRHRVGIGRRSWDVQPLAGFESSRWNVYKHEVALLFSTRFLFVLVLLSLRLSNCCPSFGRPLDYRLSLLPLAHRDNTHSFAFYSLRTAHQVIIPIQLHPSCAL